MNNENDENDENVEILTSFLDCNKMSCSEIEELMKQDSIFKPKNTNLLVKNLIDELKEIKKANKNLEKQISDINEKFLDQISNINSMFEKQRLEFQDQIKIQSKIIEEQKDSILKIKNESDLQIKKLQEEQMKFNDNLIQKMKNEKEEKLHVSPHKKKVEKIEINIEQKKQQPTNCEVALEFKPLVEVMKSIGKAMISVNDLENPLMKYCNENNMPHFNTNSYVHKASDAGVIIYDRSINYVRFRNRSFMDANIEYV